MKKVLTVLLALAMILSFAACAKTGDDKADDKKEPVADTNEPADEGKVEDNADDNAADEGDASADEEVKVMSYAEYEAAAIDDKVVIEAYVQATQSWWDNKITVYTQDADGAYFIYEMACSEEDAAKLVPGTKIRVTGYKAEFSGEIEIADATFEFVDGADTFVAEHMDATALLGTDELIKHQNKKVSFKGLTVKAVEYKNGEPGDDIYLTVTDGTNDYSFCVEVYLTGTETEVYQYVGTLLPGEKIDIDAFLYWYEGANPHVTAVSHSVLSYAEYDAAEMDSKVVIEAYVQATQSWWDNLITVYTQDADGAYFIYEMACSEEDAAKLVPGTKIRVTGYKGAWAGEVEIMDGTFEFVEGADSFIAEPMDVTELLGTDELIKHQNKKVSFTGLTVAGIEYKNGEPGDDIYVTVSYNGADYDFCVERYLTDPETDVYKAVGELQVGDVINVEGFLYWYEGVNTHITNVSK